MNLFPFSVNDAGVFALDDVTAFRAHVRQKFRGKRGVLQVLPWGRKRSAEQNAWLWGIALPLIAESCGYDDHEHERLHYDLLAIRFGTVEVAPALPGVPSRVMPTRTSSHLTTKEFAEYMEWLVRYAAEPGNLCERGIVIPLPNEPREGERADG